MDITSVIKNLAIVLALLTSAGCDQLTLDAGALDDENNGAFAGIISAKTIDSSDKIVLNWSPPANLEDLSDVKYEVYVQELTAAEAQTTLSLNGSNKDLASSSNLNLGERSGRVVKPAGTINPITLGVLKKILSDGELSYEVDNVLPTSGYAFQVIAYDGTTPVDLNASVLILSAGVLGDYIGCSSATAVSASEVKIEFDYPKGASEVTIVRDGQPIHVALNPEGTYFDRNLVAEKLYVYTCEAKVGKTTYKGKKSYRVKTPDPLAELDNFQGCVTGTALDASQIQVSFQFPSGVDSMSVYRGGLKVFSSSSSATTSFTDTGLSEGVTYSYECYANVGNESKAGSKVLTVATLTSNPPTFAGIASVAANGANSVLVSWGVTTGVPTAEYRIYGKPGSSLNFTADELLTTQTGALSKVVTGIGDEMQYTYGVLACSSSNQCAGTGVVRQLTLADAGVPTTTGVTSVSLVSSQAQLTMPYQYSNGAVAKRKIYRRSGATGGTDISNYTLIKTEAVASPYTSVPTTYSDATIAQNTTYHYIVRDEDPAGNTETNTNFVTLAVSDLTAPSFPLGVDALQKGSAGNEETELTAKFTAIVDEATDSVNGASHYVVYTKSGGGDACSSGTEFTSLAATSYTNGTQYDVAVTGLTARTNYAVCIKARDSTGNYSSTTKNLTKMTLDKTAPTFDGVQGISYNSGTAKFDVAWNASTASDIDEYKVQIWKNTATPGSTTEVRKAHASFGSGFSFDTGTFTYAEGDTLYIIVDACDDGDTITDGSENCTSTAYSAALNISVPDITPPASFAGIASTASSNESEITFNWNAPPSWTDYAGFYLYTVAADDSITQVKNCPCTSNDCATNPLLTCTWTLADPNRSYEVHVRAYDTTGNATTYLDPASNFLVQIAKDTTAPSFSGTPSVALNGTNVDVSWGTATDNQYTGAGATITYRVWRKADTDFADTNNPVADADGGAAVGSTTSTTYSDTTVTDGKTYYYVVCAEDGFSTPNVTCSPSKDFYVSDVTPPTIASLTSSFTNAERTAFNVTWDISDNESADANISVSVYLKTSDSITDKPTAIGTYLQTSESGSGVESFTITQATYKYYHYLIVAKDEANNTSTDAEITITPASPGIVTTNLLANYNAAFYSGTTFPQSASSWLDLTGNGNNGTLSGGTSWNGSGTAASPYRLTFDGVNGKVDLGALNLNAGMMVTSWVKADAFTSANRILSNQTGTSTGFSLKFDANINRYVMQAGDDRVYSSLIHSHSPVGYWKFDQTDTGTTLINEVQGGPEGTISATGVAKSAASGMAEGKAFTFTKAQTGSVNLGQPSSLNISGDLSVVLFYKKSSSGGHHSIFSSENEINELWSRSDDYFQFTTYHTDGGNNFVLSSGALADDTWHHVVAVRDNTAKTLKLYVNGALSNTTSYTKTPTGFSNGHDLYIGYGVRDNFDGQIDDLAVFNKTLSAAEVTALYAARLAEGCTSSQVETAGEWSFLGAGYDGTTATLYANGREHCSFTPSAGALNSSKNLEMSDDSVPFDGDIAQTQIYSSGTAANVKTNFNASANTFRSTSLAGMVTDNLVLRLDAANAVQGMRANTDDSCDASIKWFDLSSAGNDGTLVDFTSCGDASGWNGTGATGDPHRLAFDRTGVDGKVNLEVGDLEADLEGATALSFEFWAKPKDLRLGYQINLIHWYNSNDEYSHIVIQGRGSAHYEDGRLRIRHRASPGGGEKFIHGADFNQYEWQHVVGVLDIANDQVITYLNGVGTTTAMTYSETSLTLGTPTVAAFLGDMAYGQHLDMGYASVYKDALTAAEVTSNFNAMADRYRAQPLTGIVKPGLVMQLDAANARDKLHPNTAATCTNTTWPDLSGNGNDGTLTNFSSCGASSGWNGDGSVSDPYKIVDSSSDYVVLPSVSLSDTHSVSAWFKTNAVRTVANMNVGSIGCSSGGRFGYGMGAGNSTGTIFTTTGCSSNTWTHVSFVRSGTTVSLYVNGAFAESLTTSASNATLISALWQYNGGVSLAYLSAYNRALTAAEVKQNCNAIESRFTASDNICAN